MSMIINAESSEYDTKIALGPVQHSCNSNIKVESLFSWAPFCTSGKLGNSGRPASMLMLQLVWVLFLFQRVTCSYWRHPPPEISYRLILGLSFEWWYGRTHTDNMWYTTSHSASNVALTDIPCQVPKLIRLRRVIRQWWYLIPMFKSQEKLYVSCFSIQSLCIHHGGFFFHMNSDCIEWRSWRFAPLWYLQFIFYWCSQTPTTGRSGPVTINNMNTAKNGSAVRKWDISYSVK